LCLALLFPLSVLTAGVLALQQDLAVPVRLVTASLATAALFGLLPLAVAALRRIDLRSGFALWGASPMAWLGAALLGLSLWPLAYEATLLMNQLARLAGVELFDARLIEQARGLVDEFRTLSPVVVVLCLAIVPAAFEELFFRGFLFGALTERFRPGATVVLSAVLFGLFHVVVRDSLAVERLVPSTLLGLVLGWVRLRSGSVLPGVLLHGCHNALLLLLVFYQDGLAEADFLNLGGWLSAEAGTGHLPLVVLLAGAVIAAAGAALVWLSRQRELNPPGQE
jgi:ABC-2 type transport system permease protein/sodium transport system permease protein